MRNFFTVHPEYPKESIMIVEGETGYHIVGNMTEIKKTYLNDINNNNERDLEIAVSCSMFGWDIPLAKELSKNTC